MNLSKRTHFKFYDMVLRQKLIVGKVVASLTLILYLSQHVCRGELQLPIYTGLIFNTEI